MSLVYLYTIILLLFAVSTASAAIVTQTLEYTHNDTLLEGYLAYDNQVTGKRPVVIVFHDWNGIDEYEEGRTRMLAELGYLAFAADIYGKGVRPVDPQQSSAEAGKYYQDTQLFRGRVNAAVDFIREHDLALSDKIGAIGYCFGGRAALELARSGADVQAVVSFHGALKTDKPAEPDTVKADILVLHGTDDPHVPPAEVADFHTEMLTAKLGYSFVSYAGAVHSFTNKGAGDDPSAGSAYQERADRMSWEEMKIFLNRNLAD